MLQHGSTSSVWEDVELSAGCDAPVLISTDEILDAKTIGSWIHGRSLRRAGPFMVLDSRTLDPDVQFEAIGRAQGSLPDLGAIDSSRGGTLLLLHLEKMPLETQERLCRFLECRESWDPATFRVIAATDRAFAHVQAGDIREDLFYRLNVIHIVVGAGVDDRGGVERREPNAGERRGLTTDRRGMAAERRGSHTDRRGPITDRRAPASDWHELVAEQREVPTEQREFAIERRGPSRSAEALVVPLPASRQFTHLSSLSR